MALEPYKNNYYAQFVSSIDEVVSVAQNNRRVEVKHAIIDENANGVNEVVAAVAGKKILVLAYSIMSSGAVNATWRSASTSITGPIYMDDASKGKVCGYNSKGWFKTATGEALNLFLSAGVAVGGELTYAEID